MWTDERISVATTMWRDGKSAAQIAKHLEFCTRNAVIGKMNRLGLTRVNKAERNERHRQASQIREREKAARAALREARKKAKAAKPSNSGGGALQRWRALGAGKPGPSVPYTPIGKSIPFLELKPDECHAPMENGQLRCGHKVARKDYCEAHANLFHRRVA
jgi:GcrA cell cycle regulator